MALRIRRGTTAQRTAVTPASGELVFDTQEVKLYVGNGSTAGGLPVVAGSVIGGNLGSNLNLNGNNIVGTGDINITGTITATGNINLGDTDSDNIVFGGEVNSNIVPNVGTLTLGTSSKPWQHIYVSSVTASGTLALSGSITSAGDIIPTANNTYKLGTTGTVWSEVNATSLKLSSLNISGQVISATSSGVNLELQTLGNAFVQTSNMLATDNLEVGTTSKYRITTGGGLTTQHFDWNNAAQTGLVSETIFSTTYTQLVTNAAETVTLGIFPDPLYTGAEFTIYAENSNGIQVTKILWSTFGATTTVTTVGNSVAGTAPFASFGGTSPDPGPGTNTLRATTNTSTNSGVVTTVRIKITIFKSA